MTSEIQTLKSVILVAAHTVFLCRCIKIKLHNIKSFMLMCNQLLIFMSYYKDRYEKTSFLIVFSTVLLLKRHLAKDKLFFSKYIKKRHDARCKLVKIVKHNNL